MAPALESNPKGLQNAVAAVVAANMIGNPAVGADMSGNSVPENFDEGCILAFLAAVHIAEI
ncbi:hypothetical protein HK100_007500 [Physocladia obscura]|uniref:Uncharacterized protein n=1 Tax=Physocladia obscura TaxID=109957 RepID=A0AAD5XEW0_9FUNG|nr:hypothetical protein HK100_007500 [Physocladia obscura]